MADRCTAKRPCRERTQLEDELNRAQAKLDNLLESLAVEIKQRRHMEDLCKHCEGKLNALTQSLAEKDAALNALMSHLETERESWVRRVHANIQVLMPIVDRLAMASPSPQLVRMLRRNLESLTDSFGLSLNTDANALSPREIEICNLLRQGNSSKDVSRLLKLSLRTVDTHRRRIRHKLGLAGKRVNLVTHLQALAKKGPYTSGDLETAFP